MTIEQFRIMLNKIDFVINWSLNVSNEIMDGLLKNEKKNSFYK